MSDVKKIKPSLSEGTRDFLPLEVSKRNFIFGTIQNILRNHGFEEIQTPAIERLDTLTGKYGDDGEQLLFKIRSNKNLYKNLSTDLKERLKEEYPYDFIPKASDKGLRYDLTVPLARYVVTHQDKLPFPFKRFHIGQVWRGEKPQKGRYQEFYQCDADIIGSSSIINEIELTLIYSKVFSQLKLDVNVYYNSRRLLEWVAEYFGFVQEEKIKLFTTELDKLDKSSYEDVAKKINEIPIDIKRQTTVDSIEISYFKNLLQSDLNKLKGDIEFHSSMASQANALVGISEMQAIQKNVQALNVKFNLSLARGLDYYTGTVWEVSAKASSLTSSLGGGGRYDNLTEMFGGQNMSGVGISFGIERIYDVMEELNLFPDTISQGVRVLFVPRDASAEEFAFAQVQKLRNEDIPAEIFLGNVKKQKQFNYVEQKNIPYIVEVGADEVAAEKFRLRNSKTRETQNDLSITDIIRLLKK